jgi:hypothetical protein
MGMDPRTGALAIGEMLQEGQQVRFHLRDATTSGEELDGLLARYAGDRPGAPDWGSLLFSCLGRGEGLYGVPNHDSDLFRRYVGRIPLGGFFCNGEIGPVGGSNYLHGFTASIALLTAVDDVIAKKRDAMKILELDPASPEFEAAMQREAQALEDNPQTDEEMAWVESVSVPLDENEDE